MDPRADRITSSMVGVPFTGTLCFTGTLGGEMATTHISIRRIYTNRTYNIYHQDAGGLHSGYSP